MRTSLQSDFASVIEIVPEIEIRKLVGKSFRSIADGWVFFDSEVGVLSISLLAFSFSRSAASAIVQYKLFLAEADAQLTKTLANIERR